MRMASNCSPDVVMAPRASRLKRAYAASSRTPSSSPAVGSSRSGASTAPSPSPPGMSLSGSMMRASDAVFSLSTRRATASAVSVSVIGLFLPTRAYPR
jgi:hypothetical protein